jgi:hypothetical protein
MSKIPATLAIAAMLLASTSLAQGRGELEKSSIKAASDCVAAAALNNPNITMLYQEDRLKEVTDGIVLHSDACDNPLRAMRLLHDRLYGQGTGRTFLRGDYLADLPRAVRDRISDEVKRRIAIARGMKSPDYATPNPLPPTNVPLKRGDELRVVNVGANDVLNMRKYATDESPVIDFIPPNVQGGVYYLGESRGQWIFVQYDRAKGWVNSSFVEPITSVGGRI